MSENIPTIIVPVSVSRVFRGQDDGNNIGFLRRVDFPAQDRSVFLSVRNHCPSLSESNLDLWDFLKVQLLNTLNGQNALVEMVTWEIYREAKRKREP